MAVASRFVIDLRVGPRTLDLACQLVASVAVCGDPTAPPLFLIDDHLPYPSALLQVYGEVRHHRRKNGRGRPCLPSLKPPPGLWVGVVKKLRDAKGKLVKVTRSALFGRLPDLERRIRALGIGRRVNTSHLERLNGTLRGQQARLARRTRSGSRLTRALQWSLWLWRDRYNWTCPHGSLDGLTPAMALGLTEKVWSVLDYILYPVHVSDLQREEWSERRNGVLESALDGYNRKKSLPTS